VVASPLQRLDPDAIRLARAVAVLGSGTEFGHARRLAALDRDHAAALCDLLVTAHVLQPGRPLEFVDAQACEAIYDSLGGAERSVAHARAASVLAAAGAGPEDVARHLLRANPDARPDTVATLRDAARIARARGAPGRATEYLRRALAEPPRPHLRAMLDLELADAELHARRESSGSAARRSSFHVPRLLARAELLAVDRAARTAGEAELLAELAMEGLRDGSRDARTVCGLAGRALAVAGPGFLVAHRAACCSDGFAEADGALSSVQAALSPQAASEARGMSFLRQGRIDEALGDLRVAGSAWGLGLCHLERDELEQARAALELGAERADRFWLHTRGLIRAAAGQLEAALDDLVASGHGTLNPALLAWRSDAARVALRLGDRQRASQLADEELELAQAFGARRALGIALRQAGLVAESRTRLESSVEVLRGSGALLELARALLALGAFARRSGERVTARGPLREALDLAQRLGARATAALAADELLASGARRPKRSLTGADSLTPSEHRVADLALRGLTNREIAQTLFVAARTVKTHLTHIYQKLDIERRDQLADALQSGAEPPDLGKPWQSEPGPPLAASQHESAPRAAVADPGPVVSAAAGRSALAAGAIGPVVDYCASALARPAADPFARATTSALLGAALFHGGRFREANVAVSAALDALDGDAPPSLLADLEVVRACASLLDGSAVGELDARIGMLRLLAVAAGRAGRSLTLVESVWRWYHGALGEDPRLLATRVVGDGEFYHDQTADGPAIHLGVGAFVFMDDTTGAERILADIWADARRRGSVLAQACAVGWAAQLALRSGDVTTAELDAREAVKVCHRYGLRALELQFASVLAGALIERDELAGAEATLAAAPFDELERTVPSACALFVRGGLRVAQGRLGEAVADLRASGAAGRGLFADNPNVLPWRTTLALALTDAGFPPHEPRDLIREELTLAWRHRQGRAIGVALRARASLEHGPQRTATLREAVARSERAGARLEHVRALIDLGAALVEDASATKAREALRAALSLALAAGAVGLAGSVARRLTLVVAPGSRSASGSE
jgi:DNA-binding CsgD family transcriptional regulator